MKIVSPHYKIITDINSSNILKNIEYAGRICYKTEDKITENSANDFIKKLIKSGHESVLEHEKISILFVFDHGISHEIVRHRIASFSQESTRYVNYTKENKGGECNFVNIKPHLKNPDISFNIWFNHMLASEAAYKAMIDAGESPEMARSVLSTSLKTEIMVTANIREWRTILKQRTAKVAHPQMREIMCPLLDELKLKLPSSFEDIDY